MTISTTKDFTRGGQITLHGLRMFAQIAHTFFKVMLLAWILLAWYIWHINTTELNRYYSIKWCETELHVAMLNRNATITFRETDEPYTMSAGDVVNSVVLSNHMSIAKVQAIRAAIISTIICALFSLLIIVWFIRKGKTQLEDSHLRGSTRCAPAELKQKLVKAKESSDITLAKTNTPIAKNAEVQHFLITGTTGSGKTVCMHELLQQVRNNGQRAIVYDIEGAFIPSYYREGTDQILNPVDKRSPIWNIWQEGDIMAHFDNIAESLMPLHLAGTDPFWINAARTIFAATAFKLKQANNCNTSTLLKHLFSTDLSEIRNILKGTAAEAMVATDMEKTALSIIAVSF